MEFIHFVNAIKDSLLGVKLDRSMMMRQNVDSHKPEYQFRTTLLGKNEDTLWCHTGYRKQMGLPHAVSRYISVRKLAVNRKTPVFPLLFASGTELEERNKMKTCKLYKKYNWRELNEYWCGEKQSWIDGNIQSCLICKYNYIWKRRKNIGR